jgi:hypothetical protein
MPTHEQTFVVRGSMLDVSHAIRAAMAAVGWSTREAGEWLVCSEPPRPLLWTFPATIHVGLAEAGGGSSSVILRGSNGGWGPIQSNYLRQQMAKVRQAIEQQAALPPQQATSSNSHDPGPSQPTRNVVVNRLRLTDEAVAALEQRYGTRVMDGAYWYDRVCGAWGVEGGPGVAAMEAGLDLGGPLQPDASNGNTGVFINGRQLHPMDYVRLQQVVPMVLPGRWWLDAAGNFGVENGPMLGNLWMIVQSQFGNAGGGGEQHRSVLSTWDRTGVAVFAT